MEVEGTTGDGSVVLVTTNEVVLAREINQYCAGRGIGNQSKRKRIQSEANDGLIQHRPLEAKSEESRAHCLPPHPSEENRRGALGLV